ncbi:MAG TPA: CDP-archaeol synthase [bacterium]|nr:CDP-archaeol synthase [bacterium]
MLNCLTQAIWFLIPAGMANMFAGISGKLFPHFNRPLDGYRCMRGRRIFGDHKTIRGFVLGIPAGAIAFLVQMLIARNNTDLAYIVPPGFSDCVWLAFALPFGGLSGDALKSFLKRQLDIDSGKSWFPFDQTDWLIGSLLAAMICMPVSLTLISSVLSLGIVLHILVKMIGYSLHLQDELF